MLKIPVQQRNDQGLYKCDCCGQFTLTSTYGAYQVCKKCNWENDDCAVLFPDEACGPNTLSLNQARMKYLAS